MISVNYMGRLGNNLFQYAVACLLAKKFGDKIRNPLNTKIVVFDNPNEGRNFSDIVEVNDDNFEDVYESDDVSFNILLNGFFQNPYVVGLFEKNRDMFVEILSFSCFAFNFVHVRLGDLLEHGDVKNNMPDYEYYKRCLGNSCGGYISSDSQDHSIVKSLMRENGLYFYYQPPEETILFASRCSVKVLSLGTFSWWIGFLRSDGVKQTVFHPDCEKYAKWHGEIFVNKNWIKK